MGATRGGLEYRRANELNRLAKEERILYIEGFGLGRVLVYGTQMRDYETWFMVEAIAAPKGSSLREQRIHPRQVKKIDGLHSEDRLPKISFKRYQSTSMVVDYESGEVLTVGSEKMENEQVCRIMLLADLYRGTSEFFEITSSFEEV